MPISNLQQMRSAMAQNGAEQIYVKRLAANDNSKQQVYLGSDFSTLNIIPHAEIIACPEPKEPNFKAALNFFWITPEGQAEPAPHAQLILYPDYPEVRLSGFLLGCREKPSQLMQNREAGRLLFLGVSKDGRVLAYAAPHDSPIVQELDALGQLETSGVFQVIAPPEVSVTDTREALLQELGRIHRLGWVAAQKLSTDGTTITYAGQNGGGFTLESYLGIGANSRSEPDYLGWEVKQYAVSNLAFPERGSAITLMTSEPNGGVYSRDFSQFMRTYGRMSSKTPDRIDFTGKHIVGEQNKTTGLTLELRGYDVGTNKITDINGGLHLVDTRGESAAAWNFSGLLDHWSRKHNQAVYVPCQSDKESTGSRYRYGDTVRLGEGTEALLFIRALSSAWVYYDPAPKIEQASSVRPKAKRRNQFRILFRHLSPLYHQFTIARVL